VEKYLQGTVEGSDFPKSETSYKDRAFINGIIRKTKPKTVVEMGTAAGSSACVILNALRDVNDANLYSFDYNETWYREKGQNNARKTGFLVEKTLPGLMHKWNWYTGGVPSKYLDAHLPKDGVDICFIDTVHYNPGELLNILEILPFMKKNGIIIVHDTAYHALKPNALGTTCLTLMNTLKGKRLRLRSEKTMGLENISAVVLDDDIDAMLFPLFANLSLPWSYQITHDDFIDMFRHFSKYYYQTLVSVFVYYSVFYLNNWLNDTETAARAAERDTMKYLGVCKSGGRFNSKPTVAMVTQAGDNVPSQTFIANQRYLMNAKVDFYTLGNPPTHVNSVNLRTPYNLAYADILQQNGTTAGLTEGEMIVAASFLLENTDVVFAQFGNVGADIMNICKQLNLPLIVHFHGYDISIKAHVNSYKSKYQQMFKYASYIIAVSKRMRDTLIELGCSAEKIVYNPCAPSNVYYNIKPTFEEKLFVAAGRFVQKKAPHNTILAFEKVLEKHPDARLIVAGDGQLFDYCQELVQKRNLVDKIYMPRIFNSAQLQEWIGQACAFVQHSVTAPNGDKEGTPVVVCEASLAGLPVVSTLHAGIPDVIINGTTGLLVKEGDIEGMAQHMIWLLDNPDKAKEMGQAGKTYIWNNFNMEKHIKILDEIVYKAANKNNCKSQKYTMNAGVNNIAFARLGYSASWNLGDHIQTLATEEFSPPQTSTITIERDKLAFYDGKLVFLIMQGYFFTLAEQCTFPPSENIIPIFFGFHIEDSPRTRDVYASQQYINYFKKHEPIGCRDISTMNFLKARGVDAFFSRCLTLTVQKRDASKIEKANKVFFIDAPDWLYPGDNTGEVFNTIYNNAVFLSQVVDENPAIIPDSKKRIQADNLLSTLSNEAKLVVTSRLHITAPCIALGIPVVCIPRLVTPSRYEAIQGLIPLYYFPSEVAENDYEETRNNFIRTGINWNPLPQDIEALKIDIVSALKNKMREVQEKYNHL